jgi:hypothetical protein
MALAHPKVGRKANHERAGAEAMKINFRTCTEAELWVYAAGDLAESGIESVLVGGAVASIYTSGAYQSGLKTFRN